MGRLEWHHTATWAANPWPITPADEKLAHAVIELRLGEGGGHAGVSLEHRFAVKCLAHLWRTSGVLASMFAGEE
jgi:hypothetical protein